MKRPRDKAERLEHLRRWFLASKPTWVKDEPQADACTLAVANDSQVAEFLNLLWSPEGSAIGWIVPEADKWSASFNDSELTDENDDNWVLIFDTVDDARVGLMDSIPRLIDKRIVDMAHYAVEHIEEELGFWRNDLLPPGDTAINWLVNRLWERGRFDIDDRRWMKKCTVKEISQAGLYGLGGSEQDMLISMAHMGTFQVGKNPPEKIRKAAEVLRLCHLLDGHPDIGAYSINEAGRQAADTILRTQVRARIGKKS